MKKLALIALLSVGLPAGSAISQESVSLLTAETAIENVPDFINHLHQRQWVRLDDSGTISGRVAVLSADGQPEGRIGAQVLVSRDGQLLYETESGVDGTFELKGLQPGTYALQSRSEYTFAAFALHVLPSSAQSLSSSLDVYAAVIPADRIDNLVTELSVPGELNDGGSLYYRSFSKDPLATRRQFNNSPQVALQNDVLVGRVSRPGWTFSEQDLSGTIAQVIKDGEVFARAAVGADGFFRVSNMAPGVYDLLVVGDDGFAVLAFEAVPAQGLVGTPSGSARFVSTQAGMVSDTLCCEMIQTPELSAFSGGLAGTQGMPMEMGTPVVGGGFAGPGGFGGGGAGGGGGFGGIGGLGGLLGIAGLVAGIIALSDDDSGQGTPIAP
jgi:hypothetical protein